MLETEKLKIETHLFRFHPLPGVECRPGDNSRHCPVEIIANGRRAVVILTEIEGSPVKKEIKKRFGHIAWLAYREFLSPETFWHSTRFYYRSNRKFLGRRWLYRAWLYRPYSFQINSLFFPVITLKTIE